MIKLYSKDGLTEKAELRKFNYTGQFMGACDLLATLSSPIEIDFEIGDYCEYRGERFTLNYEAAKSKKARRLSTSDAFVYDNVKFNSQGDDLTMVEFMDVVPKDNEIHFTTKSQISFYASSANALAERIQINLDYYFKGEKKFNLTVLPEAISEGKFITIEAGTSIWNVVTLFNEQFGLNYIIRNRDITVGTAGVAVGKVLGYGKGNGLYDIEQTTNVDARIITRLRAYGSTKNMPRFYYNELKDENGNPYISKSNDIPNLMLPNFPYQERDPRNIFIDSDNKDKYGLRYGTVYFDGRDDEHAEIYPSIEGMTKQQLNDAGITVSLPPNDNGIINEVLGAENPDDDGLIPDEGKGEIAAQFKIILKDLGFDLTEKDEDGQYKYATQDTMQISMKSGMCVARTFDIVENGIVKDTSLGYTRYIIECNREEDNSIQGGTAFPNNIYKIEAGDKFVILGIAMPDVYVKAAAQRLLVAGKEYLAQNDSTKYNYIPKVDEIFMANNPQIAEKIKEGDILSFTDDDLNIDVSQIIQTLTITYDAEKSIIPTYDVVVNDERIAGALEKMQNSINMLASNQTGISLDQVKSLVASIGTRYFLSKINDDTASGNMNFMQNVSIVKDLLVKENIISQKSIISDVFQNSTFTAGQFGSGFQIKRDANGQSYMEVDNLLVRRETVFNRLTIAEIKSVGGTILLSLANMQVLAVEEKASTWKCYFDTDNLTIPNDFAIGDQAICRRFTGANIKYYWARVMAVGDDYIELSKTDKDGSGIPASFDEIVQLGNRTDVNRQYAIMLSAYGSAAPSINQYAGINSYDLTGKEVTAISPKGNKFTGSFTVSTNGTTAPVYKERGVFANGTTYYLDDRVSYLGSYWVCIVNTTITTPSEGSSTWRKETSGQTDIDKATNQVRTEYKADFVVMDTKIASKVSQTDFNALGNRVSTSASDIIQLSNSITSVVEKVDNISIGGNNLMDTQLNPYPQNAVGNNLTIVAHEHNGKRGYRVSGTITNQSWGSFVIWNIVGNKLQDIKSLYSFSIYAEDLSGGKLNNYIAGIFRSGDSSNLALNSDWQKVTDGRRYKYPNMKVNNTYDPNGKIIYFHSYVANEPCDFFIAEPMLEIGTICSEYKPSQKETNYNIQLAQDKATQAQTDANTANSLLTNIASDNKLTPNEKQETKKEWDVIVSEYPKNIAQANKFGISTTAYTNAYNTLNSYITPLLSNIGVTSDINGVNFRATFKAYYDARTDLLNAISTKAKDLADSAQTSANNAQNTANSKNRTYRQDAQPIVPSGGHKEGDLWYKESLVDVSGNINADISKNKYQLQHRWNGTTWVRINWSASTSVIEQTESSIKLLTEKTGINDLGAGQTLKSLIDQTPEQIKLEVSKLQFGGRNLLPNTNKGVSGYDLTMAAGYDTKLSAVEALGVNAIKLTTTTIGTAYHVLGHTMLHSLFENNTQYTISFDVYSSFNSNCGVHIMHRNGSNGLLNWGGFAVKKDTWVHVELTAWTNAVAISGQVIYMLGLNMIGQVTIANLQVEKGNKASGWTPALEDTDANIKQAQDAAVEEVKAGLKVEANGVTIFGEKFTVNSLMIAKAIEAQSLNVGGNMTISQNGTITIANGKIILNADGSGRLANGNIVWDKNGNVTVLGKFETDKNGNRIIIDPNLNTIQMINSLNGKSCEILNIGWEDVGFGILRPTILMKEYSDDGSSVRGSIIVSPFTFGMYRDGRSDLPFIEIAGGWTSKRIKLSDYSLPSSRPSVKGTLWRDGEVLKVVP